VHGRSLACCVFVVGDPLLFALKLVETFEHRQPQNTQLAVRFMHFEVQPRIILCMVYVEGLTMPAHNAGRLIQCTTFSIHSSTAARWPKNIAQYILHPTNQIIRLIRMPDSPCSCAGRVMPHVLPNTTTQSGRCCCTTCCCEHATHRDHQDSIHNAPIHSVSSMK
jgi:hypothetical protein